MKTVDTDDIIEFDTSQWESKFVGHGDKIKVVSEYIEMHAAGLQRPNKPVGTFLLTGPTGVGKTRLAETCAEVLHGDDKHILRVDCGEFQMDHEVAKLIGAPPGYLGHRETVAALSQAFINSKTSETSKICVILFDEIEKAATSLTKLLLGVMDRATMRLGDNSTVSFKNCLIFFTSNLGANLQSKGQLGFETPIGPVTAGIRGAKGFLSPEFRNRIDAQLEFRAYTRSEVAAILDIELSKLQEHLTDRLEKKAFIFTCSEGVKKVLLEEGFSKEFGVRELKRTIDRKLLLPLARLVNQGLVRPGCHIRATLKQGTEIKFGFAEGLVA